MTLGSAKHVPHEVKARGVADGLKLVCPNRHFSERGSTVHIDSYTRQWAVLLALLAPVTCGF